nr:unnamed protein product [Callosobruchus chinensis]
MPISSCAATIERKKSSKPLILPKNPEQNELQPVEKSLLKIAPALPVPEKRALCVRSHSTLNASALSKIQDGSLQCEPSVLRTYPDGSLHVSRLQEEKEIHPDRMSLDRKGLTMIPIIDGEPRLRLLSLQHNLINSLEMLSKQSFPSLVFLDIYDNQLEQMQSLEKLENLRVLLMGKNRIKKIEGLEHMKKIEVLDLHGNQISQVGGLSALIELKVLNLAGNQIKIIGSRDLEGLHSLLELNLRRNRLKKLIGFDQVPNLSKLFLSNNDLQSNQQQVLVSLPQCDNSVKNKTDSSSVLSVATTSSSNLSAPSHFSNNSNISNRSLTRNVKSAVYGKSFSQKCHARAATAKVKKQTPPLAKDREQGGDYLIEICGRHLNIYGQGAVRFIDKPWDASRANDVITAKFNYVNFNSITSTFCKLRHRFPNIDMLVFKETNIHCLGQLNALAEIQGFSSLSIDTEGNPICQKEWRMYAIYRLAHWGLKIINEQEITEEEIKTANEEYQSLSDLALWSLPDVLLQPLLVRLRLDVNNSITEQNAKKWLLSADPELRSVVSKEALQWKKSTSVQEESLMKQKAKQHISTLLEEMVNSVNKLRLLDEEWPTILHNFVQNTLLDYSQLDLYLKQKMQELNK